MRKHLVDKAMRRRPGARLKAYTGIERAARAPLSPLFETVFRRARRHDGTARLLRYADLERAR